MAGAGGTHLATTNFSELFASSRCPHERIIFISQEGLIAAKSDIPDIPVFRLVVTDMLQWRDVLGVAGHKLGATD
jgi:hypothetical protein